MAKSIYDPKGDHETFRGGLDRYLGPPAQAHSKMSEDLTDGDAEADKTREVDCCGEDADEPVCRIEKELKRKGEDTK